MWSRYTIPGASTLRYESAPQRPEDVLCPDSEDEEVLRTKKRRRIEELGRDYLEGRGHFIQTASLRGPFERGWKNPWASTMSKATPQAAVKQGPGEKKKGLITEKPKDRIDEILAIASKETLKYAPPKERPSRRRRDQDSATASLRSSPERRVPRPVKAQATGDWLRRIDPTAHLARNTSDHSPTPTPLPKPRSSPPSDIRYPSRYRDRTRDATPSIHDGIGDTVQPPAVAVKGKAILAQKSAIVDPPGNVMVNPSAPTISKRLSKETIEFDPPRLGKFVLQKRSAKYLTDPTREAEIQHRLPGADTSADPFQSGLSDRIKAKFYMSSGSPSISLENAKGTTIVDNLHSVVDHASHSTVVPDEKPAKLRSKTANARRLTFTPNGGPKLQAPRRFSRPQQDVSYEIRGDSMQEDPQKGPVAPSEKTSHATVPTAKTSTKSSGNLLTNSSRSKEASEILPEAQIVHDPARRPLEYVSGLSTGVLETEKELPEPTMLDEGDSYADLATQAAMEKARMRFNDDLLADLKAVSPEEPHIGHHPEQTPRHDLNARPPHTKTPAHEPMSTQAMFDEMSPFAVTTIKKRSPILTSRAAFITSPTPAPSKPLNASPSHQPPPLSFPAYSPSMATSTASSASRTSSQKPVNSRPKPTTTTRQPRNGADPTSTTPQRTPLSTLPSFSIRPDGTLSESAVVQDGQQQEHVPAPSLPSLPTGDESWATLPEIGMRRAEVLIPGKRGSGSTGVASPLRIEVPGEAMEGGGGDSYDLDAAVEDAGSFLGDWDVIAEAKKEGRRARGAVES